MNKYHVALCRARTLVPLGIAIAFAVLLLSSSALAATFTQQSPAADSVVTVSPTTLSVAVADTVPLLGTPVMLVDGTPRVATMSYAVVTPGYWYFDEYDWDYYWIPPIYDYKRATVSCSVGTLADRSHSVAVTLASGTAPTSTSWNFWIAEKPVFSAMVPASGTTTKTVSPTISVKATDNSGVTDCSATVDGAPATATYNATTKLVTVSPGTLSNFASHTVSVTVGDASGNTNSVSWSFNISAPETTWSNAFPAPGAVLSVPPRYVGVEASCTSSLIAATRTMLFDGVVDSSAGWVTGDAKHGRMYLYPPTAGQDGSHTVIASVANAGGTTASYTWTFYTRVAPTLGSPSPAAGSIVVTALPEITIPAADNSAVTTVTAVVNGAMATATYDPSRGIARVTPAAPLPDDGDTTVTVTAYDAQGLSAQATWTFEVQTGSVMSGNADNCYSCHPQAYNDSDAYYGISMGTPCEWCHSPHPNPSTSLHPRSDITGCSPCHRSQLLIEHNRPGMTCLSCHNSSNPTVRAAIAAGDTKCVTCHGDVSSAHLAFHNSGVANTPLSGTSVVCGDCHDTNLVTEHAKSTSSSKAAECAACHPTPRDTVTSWAKDCVTAGCHVVGTSKEMHGNQTAAHVRPSSTDACFESGCHLDQSLSAIHKVPGCLACHGAGKTPTGVCLTCHPERALPHGYDPAKHTASSTCVLECHAPLQSMTELKPVHYTSSASFTCATCHAVKVDSIRPWDKTCTSCHPVAQLHTAAAASHIGTDTAYSQVNFFGNGCSSSASHTDMQNCHDISSLANLHSNMPNNGCGVCHSSPNTPKKECLDCHQVGRSTSYTVAGATTSALATAYPNSDISISSGWTYTTTPAGQPRFAVVNTPYPVSDTSRYVTITTSTAGGVVFGFDRSTKLAPDNAQIMQVTVYAKGKAAIYNQRKMQGLFRVGGQDYQIGNQSTALSTTFPTGAGTALQSSGIIGYDYTREPLYGESYYGNPKTGQRWTAAQLNGTDPTNSLDGFGVALTSSTGANNVSLSQVYLRVSYYTVGASRPSPTVGTSTYHHNNVKYLHDPADAAAGKRFGVDPTAHGWYDALYYQDCYDFCHIGNGGSPTFTAKQGTWMWYSVGGDPYDAVAGTRTLALKSITLPADSPKLNFDTNYILGTGASGYVEISTNGGTSWTPLSGTVGGSPKASLTGSAGGWVAASYDLSAYAGQTVKLRFRYVNGSSFAEGWALDNLMLRSDSGAIFSDDAETLKTDWTNTYWTRSRGAFPYI